MEFAVDIFDVGADSLDSNAHTVCDHFVAETVHEADDDFPLLVR